MKKIQLLLVLSFAFLCLIVCFFGSDLIKNTNTGYADADIDGYVEYVSEEDNNSWIIINFNQEESPTPNNFATECKVPTSDSANQSGSCVPK